MAHDILIIGSGATGLTAALCIAAAAFSAEPTKLDELLSFSNPARCEASKTQEAFLRSMWSSDDDGNVVARVPEAPGSKMGDFGIGKVSRSGGWQSLDLPVSGIWHGLNLVAIRQSFPEGGDPPSISLAFRDPALRVAQTAKSIGFPSSGTQIEDDDGYSVEFSIEQDPDRPDLTLLTCGWG